MIKFWKRKNKKGQLQIGEMEISPISAAMGLIGGALIFYMMGNTGKVQLGLFWRIIGFVGGAIACFFVANFVLNRY